MNVTIHHGDALDVLRTLADGSVDAVVTDPPYGLEFMGKDWDSFGGKPRGRDEAQRKAQQESGEWWAGNYGSYLGGGTAKPRPGQMRAFQSWCEQWAAECLRVLKPGGHMLAFGGTRTWHRLACAVEDAGFEVRDSIAWLYGSGFPKSLDVSKAIDKAAGAERTEVVGTRGLARWKDGAPAGVAMKDDGGIRQNFDKVNTLHAPATPAAKQWQGWGTALKPAFEPIVVARKPLAGTVAGNVLAHGTGALNIAACRVAPGTAVGGGGNGSANVGGIMGPKTGERPRVEPHTAGRWPTNVVLDEHAAAELDEQSGTLTGGAMKAGTRPKGERNTYGQDAASGYETQRDTYADTGGASRFFPVFRYQAKAPTRERASYERDGAGEGRVIEGASGKVRQCNVCGNRTIRSGETAPACGHGDFAFVPTERRTDRVAHPTVKPLALMRWLVRLVTPPGGLVLDPFAGSGTTVEAAILEGFDVIGVEREAEYLPLIEQRIARATPKAEPKPSAVAEALALFDFEEPA